MVAKLQRGISCSLFIPAGKDGYFFITRSSTNQDTLHIDTMIERHHRGIFYCIVFLIVGVTDCRHSTEPIPSPLKNPRDYTWTMDTLSVDGQIQTSLEDIWGSSASDVYAVGRNSGYGETIFHFDGKNWGAIHPLPGTDYANGGRSYELESIIGFSGSDIWVSGAELYYNKFPPPNYLDSSVIFHFDGSAWAKQILPGREFRVYNLWGNRPDNIWATGLRAIWHFNGTNWNRDSLPSSIVPQATTTWIGSLVQVNDGSIYCIVYGHNGAPSYLLRKTASWVVLDSAVEPNFRWGSGRLWRSPEGTTYSVGYGVYKLDSPTTWSRVFNTADQLSAIRGHDDDLFALSGVFGTIHYYDGASVTENHQFESPYIVFTSLWRTSDQVFISGFNVGPGIQITGFIIRGN